VEVAFALQARLHASKRGGHVSVVDGEGALLADQPPTIRERVRNLMGEKGIGHALGARVTRAQAGAVVLSSRATLPADLIVWVAGGAPSPLIAASDLPRDDDGYLLVDRTLHVVGDDNVPVWGAGDCIAIRGAKPMSRSGIEAIRQGPVLLRNLRAALGVGRPARFRLPARSVALISTADGRAVARRGPVHGYGRWAWWLKERIDRKFVARFARPCDETRAPAS
jgi:NADH dehydrogenase FAD-containing subunit